MPVVVEIIKHKTEVEKTFYKCKKCGKAGIYSMTKILCDECIKKQHKTFEEEIKKNNNYI
jgi:PII-like signaling protein